MGPLFDTAGERDAIIQPLLDRAMGVAVLTQPDYMVVRDELGFMAPNGAHPGNLIDRLINSPDNPDTPSIVKAVCAAVVGSAVVTVQ